MRDLGEVHLLLRYTQVQYIRPLSVYTARIFMLNTKQTSIRHLFLHNARFLLNEESITSPRRGQLNLRLISRKPAEATRSSGTRKHRHERIGRDASSRHDPAEARLRRLK